MSSLLTRETQSVIERQNIHPLELNDPIAFHNIDPVRLDWLEKTSAPLPRNQDVPLDAFQKPDGQSVLVTLSHGWYYQTHPDPEGDKLDLIQKQFAPKLRSRFPDTSILVFFDFLATPQSPRTEDEEKIFRLAMNHMNSVYVYCDVALFLEARLPRVDMSEFVSRIDLTKYDFRMFHGSIQVKKIKHVQEEEEKTRNSNATPQINDIILTMDKMPIKSLDIEECSSDDDSSVEEKIEDDSSEEESEAEDSAEEEDSSEEESTEESSAKESSGESTEESSEEESSEESSVEGNSEASTEESENESSEESVEESSSSSSHESDDEENIESTK